MKKFFCVILVTIMTFTLLCVPLSAFDNSNSKNVTLVLNPLQLTIIKFQSKSKPDTETAKEIMRTIGYPESIIQKTPAEKLLKIFNSIQISKGEEYYCFSDKTTVLKVSSSEYESECLSENTNQLQSSTGWEHDDAENSWMKISTYYFKGQKDSTDFIYSSVCTWKRAPVLRFEDYMGIAATEGSINPRTAVGIFTYNQINYETRASTEKYTTKEGQRNLNETPSVGRMFYCSFNLPNNSLTTDLSGNVTGVYYEDFQFTLFIDAKVYEPTFNVSSAYFHKTVELLLDVSVSAGAGGLSGSLSISPRLCFSSISCNIPYPFE